jgi:large subunit ribosomal protein L32
MAVQKSRKTPSKRGMRRAHDALKAPTLSTEPTTGETARKAGSFHVPGIKPA